MGLVPFLGSRAWGSPCLHPPARQPERPRRGSKRQLDQLALLAGHPATYNTASRLLSRAPLGSAEAHPCDMRGSLSRDQIRPCPRPVTADAGLRPRCPAWEGPTDSTKIT